jgi:catechol 2,3-dioxygenase
LRVQLLDQRLAASTRLGAVHLTVTDLDRSVAYYQDAIGLRQHGRTDASAAMGAGDEHLVVLHEQPGARPAGRHSGLYHFALLYPSREELARAVLRVAAAGAPVDGASDHGTHEAIYLPDPDGNGIELAADRPRDLWPDLNGPDAYAGGPAALDVEDLLSTITGEQPVHHAGAGLRMGHVHLHVGDLGPSSRFYVEGLGFDVVTSLPSAVFVSAGGYHHHVAFTVWRGDGAPPAPADSVGLRHWTLVVEGEHELAAVRSRLEAIGAPVDERPDGAGLVTRDPFGIAVAVVA